MEVVQAIHAFPWLSHCKPVDVDIIVVVVDVGVDVEEVLVMLYRSEPFK